MFAIYKKELRSYFINAVGYVYIGVFLAISAFLCCKHNSVNKSVADYVLIGSAKVGDVYFFAALFRIMQYIHNGGFKSRKAHIKGAAFNSRFGKVESWCDSPKILAAQALFFFFRYVFVFCRRAFLFLLF